MNNEHTTRGDINQFLPLKTKFEVELKHFKLRSPRRSYNFDDFFKKFVKRHNTNEI